MEVVIIKPPEEISQFSVFSFIACSFTACHVVSSLSVHAFCHIYAPSLWHGCSSLKYAADNVNPVPTPPPPGQAVDTWQKNSTLIHPGPQVNSSGIHSFSHQFSTLSKPFSN
jgi:hypothetical protein